MTLEAKGSSIPTLPFLGSCFLSRDKIMEYKIYAEFLEGKAHSQFIDALKNDWVEKAALMPDAHAGYSLPIGAVVATKDKIVPAWVGYDIGCGMCAQRTSFRKNEIEEFSNEIFNDVYSKIPVGFKHHEMAQKEFQFKSKPSEFLRNEFELKGLGQLGTLGGGNHFIEIGYDEDQYVWIIVHSGSRNIGHKVATHYMKIAGGGKCREGHYPLDVDSEDGHLYIEDLNFCLEFALENRLRILNSTFNILESYTPGIKTETVINRNHNHAEFSNGMWIHRKGATHAEKGMLGVIPGNMRDGSFIVEGKGCPDSLWSSSHGAGRVMSRSQAKKEVDLNDFQDQMIGVKAKVDSATLDESPFAYKNIFDVMDQQKYLVTVLHHVKPIINIKG